MPKDKKESINTGKLANVFRIPSLVFLRSNKEVLVKSKFYKGKGKTSEKPKDVSKEYSYAQVSKSNIKKIVKIKDNFPNFSTKKIEKVHKVLNRPKKNKSRLNIGPIKKTSHNFNKFEHLSKVYVTL